ncbi:hypothetical protein ACIQUG_21415 [Ensifer sp. NPDC090286]|uniref:hypothetical protein n=1 Tax=Ensifer sp. NPDC090286 TaxID=3363991 RepID=UPI00383A6DC8
MKQNDPGLNDPRTYPITDGVRSRKVNVLKSLDSGHYDLTEFIGKYGLSPIEAREILERIGPARSSLDAYMKERSTE